MRPWLDCDPTAASDVFCFCSLKEIEMTERREKRLLICSDERSLGCKLLSLIHIYRSRKDTFTYFNIIADLRPHYYIGRCISQKLLDSYRSYFTSLSEKVLSSAALSRRQAPIQLISNCLLSHKIYSRFYSTGTVVSFSPSGIFP